MSRTDGPDGLAKAGRRRSRSDQSLKARQAALHSALAKVVSRAEPRFTFPPYTPPELAPQPEVGAFRIDQLCLGQCRFACTGDVPRGGHRFCGAPTEIGSGNLHGSWCADHLPHVLSSGGAGWLSRAMADVKLAERAA